MDIYKKYNWVDVKEIATGIFSNYDYMIYWIEDAWNLLMFGRPVVERCIAGNNLSDYEVIDSFLWLISLYDVFYDYQIKIKDEPGWSQYERLTPEGYHVLDYSPKDFNHFLVDIDLWEKKLSVFMQEHILKYIIEEGFQFEDYNTYGLGEHHTAESVRRDATYHFLSSILNIEIQARREFFINKIFEIYKANSIDILTFMAGYHYVEHYTDYKERIVQIKESKESRLLENPYLDDYMVDEDIQDEINDLMNDMPVSIMDLMDFYYGTRDASHELDVYEWIDLGMQKIC